MTTDLPPLFPDDEAVALAVALRAAAAGVTGIEETATRALDKLARLLPARQRDQIAAVQQATTSLPFSGAPKADLAALAALATACRDHGTVTFAYESRDGTPSSRHVEPHTLLASHGRWYLLAYDLDRDAWRTFRVDRLTGPAPTGRRAPSRRLPAPDASTYLTASLTAAPTRYPARATVPYDAATARTRSGAFPSRVHPLDDHTCTIDLSADDPLHIAVRLLALGPEATLHGDPELAPHLAQMGHQLLQAARALTPQANDTDEAGR
ncbi:helix-turn-helix transcriptional regulator [Streptomyces roseoverticillatus]|uniref:helix-turn-helix transcriptional regulator n=1 Tax=Streptomyces roseoverticillatus TaxID=66429 RepID=UPI0012FE93A7|nr:WYL domain-containing protein [Streptomyces roseoverticillatus]